MTHWRLLKKRFWKNLDQGYKDTNSIEVGITLGILYFGAEALNWDFKTLGYRTGIAMKHKGVELKPLKI